MQRPNLSRLNTGETLLFIYRFEKTLSYFLYYVPFLNNVTVLLICSDVFHNRLFSPNSGSVELLFCHVEVPVMSSLTSQSFWD